MTLSRPIDEPKPALAVQARPDFVETAAVRELQERAVAYLKAGFPVHFRGPAGTGKTTLGLHVAAQIGRPVLFIAGDEQFSTSDLIGGQFGYSYRKVVDRFIHTVTKTEEDAVQRWVDNRLTTACREGMTLVYDEFTRSRPEANNVLLGVLEERMLILPSMSRKDSYIRVHPEFRVIFTSNPREYAGVHLAQDALSDRMVTIDVEFYDRETEVAITAARSGLPLHAAARVVDLVRDYRALGEYTQAPTMRACIMIARVAAMQSLDLAADDPQFVAICLDVLASRADTSSAGRATRQQQRELIIGLLAKYC